MSESYKQFVENLTALLVAEREMYALIDEVAKKWPSATKEERLALTARLTEKAKALESLPPVPPPSNIAEFQISKHLPDRGDIQ